MAHRDHPRLSIRIESPHQSPLIVKVPEVKAAGHGRAEVLESRVDHTHDLHPPVDFSFMFLQTISDIGREKPRDCPPHKLVRDELGRTASTALRLNNNMLVHLEGITELVTKNFLSPDQIQWLDLSFNHLEHIEPVILNLSNLKMLYFHGNKITNIGEVNKLKDLNELLSLTLHGNPIEHEKMYRTYVLAKLPQIRKFDFSYITRRDRDTVRTAGKWLPKPPRVRKRRMSDDDTDF